MRLIVVAIFVVLAGLARASCPSTPDPPADVHYVFLSSASYDGNMGGLSGADDLCQGLADTNPTLATYGKEARSYKAWLSDSNASPSGRFTYTEDIPYALPDGTTVADNWADFASADNHKAAISMTESCATIGGGDGGVFDDSCFARTQTKADGGLSDMGSACADWTTSDPMSEYHDLGCFHNSANEHWSQGQGDAFPMPKDCDSTIRIYCVQQALPAKR